MTERQASRQTSPANANPRGHLKIRPDPESLKRAKPECLAHKKAFFEHSPFGTGCNFDQGPVD